MVEASSAIPEKADSGMLTEFMEASMGRIFKGCSRVSDLHYTLVPVSAVFKALENVWALYVSQTEEVVRGQQAGSTRAR